MIIRPATIEDARLLFEWRNDPLTRAMFINQDVVQLPDHMAWLSRRLARTDPALFIAEVDGVPVATVRIDDGELSYTVAPEHRGKGFATMMLTIVRQRFGSKIAKIKPNNLASIAAASKAGHLVELI